jgi:HEAT repeat protein
MKRAILLLMAFFPLVFPVAAAEPEKTVFGPERYDVKERYGKDNIHKAEFKAAEGRYIIRLQNGGRPAERSDFIRFTLNGQNLLPDGSYPYAFLVCVVNLKKENSFEILLKDAKPSGFKRPPLPPRFVTVSVLPFAGKLPEAVYGISAWDGLKDVASQLQMMKAESASLAVTSINLEKDAAARATAMRQLSDRKDAGARQFISSVFQDTLGNADVRAESALALGALGDRSSIPVLMHGVLDPEEKVRLASSRALSFYPEEETREPLKNMLARLDLMRRDAVMRAMVEAGWKPVAALMELAETNDPHISRTAIGLLGSAGDVRATDLLLKLFQDPGRRDVRAIIIALGKTGDSRAIEPIARMAQDPVRRIGSEGELGTALADLGDMKSSGLIAEMIRKTESRQARQQLLLAYKKLTGKEYQ